jgi:CheY-like chemotaxis protein
MPNMNGPEATNQIRKLGYKGPIFGVTGNALPSDMEIFIKAGASKVLIKPVDTAIISNSFRGK